MNILRRFKFNKLSEVFTPNTVAKLSYVVRDNIENELSKNLTLSGRQIILYGHSGGGKTTLVRRKIRELKINYIMSHCETNTTFTELLLNAFDGLNKFYISEKNTNRSYSISSKLKAEYNSLLSEINSTISQSESFKLVRIVPPQLTPQKLAQFLGEVHAVWIIEDFHKISITEKQRIADVLKVFIDSANDFPDVKIICIGAVDTARELIQLDSNLFPRISEIHVPLLTDEEIKCFIEKGCKLLRISMSDKLIDKIVFYSNNLGSLAHQMCYDICFSNNINRTLIFKKYIDDAYFKNAIEAYINSNSDTLKSVYDSLVKDKLVWYILKSFVIAGKSINYNEIKMRVNKRNRNYLEEEINQKLIELSDIECNIIRYDANSGKYSISTPFWGAFLKMQFAIEDAERNRAQKNRINPNLILKDQNDADAYLYSLILKQLEMLKKLQE